MQSWSYRIVSGSDTASANPLAMAQAAEFWDTAGTALAGHGDVIIDGHQAYNVSDANTFTLITYESPTIVRTGTGSIDIAAGRDFVLADQKAPAWSIPPAAIRWRSPDPGFTVQTVDDPLNPGSTITIPVAANPEGFLAPVIVTCDLAFNCNPYGPSTQAAYPVNGGHLTLTAQRDIIGFEHPTVLSAGNGSLPNQQYFAPWLLAQGTFPVQRRFRALLAAVGLSVDRRAVLHPCPRPVGGSISAASTRA